jgi:hypothetical protein
LFAGRVEILLWGWAILSPWLFRVIAPRDAAIACLVVGWTFLPVAEYPASAFGHPAGLVSSTHALAVPTALLANKATAIGLGCLLGIAFFDRRTFLALAPKPVDAAIAAWCAVPVASSLAQGGPLAEGLAQSRYLALAWGVPYLVGRAYLGDEAGRKSLALALVAVGLAFVPLCLAEFVAGPFVDEWVYGPHPYRFEGASRTVGHRPLGFQEHGNQLGIWMAASATASAWLWATGTSRKPLGIPGAWATAALVTVVLINQSLGGIVLLAVVTAPLLATVPRSHGGRSWKVGWLAVLGALGVILLTALVVLAARRGFDPASIREGLRDTFRGVGKTSFTWRLARSEEFLPRALEQPLLGWGRADWLAAGRTFVNPVNLGSWLVILGMYGVVGLAASTAVWIVPPVAEALRGGVREWLGPARGATGALVALLALAWLDSFSNACVILPILAASGGLARTTHRR